jgi:RNA 2',3'-cyclic 3'-phosphodiesterase
MPTAQNLRVFLAISISQTASSILQRQLSSLKPTLEKYKLSWIPQQNWHITVKFIGTLQAQQIPVLARELTAELQQSPTFQLELTSVDWFPNKTKPIMLAAIPVPCEPLNQLASRVDKTLARYGIVRNSKPFRAHLSLARSHKRAKHTASQLLSAPLTPITVAVSQVDLYQSQFEKQGVYYSKLANFKLLS